MADCFGHEAVRMRIIGALTIAAGIEATISSRVSTIHM
jgi:hypothetical protein